MEKLTGEYVLGRQYDVWDAHATDGRWWVITNPVKSGVNERRRRGFFPMLSMVGHPSGANP